MTQIVYDLQSVSFYFHANRGFYYAVFSEAVSVLK